MDIVTAYTAIYLREIKGRHTSTYSSAGPDGKLVVTDRRVQVYAALYVAPLGAGEHRVDPRSRFQVRSLTILEDDRREDCFVTEFTDASLAQVYCEHAAHLRETAHKRRF